MRGCAALQRTFAVLLVFGLAGGLPAVPTGPAGAATPKARVILWEGVTPDFLRSLEEVSSYDLVYRYETIRGAAVAVPRAGVADVIAFAEARGLRAVRDHKIQAGLNASTKTVHVKPSGAGSPGAWALGYTGAGVTVGIVDTGIDAAHLSLNDQDDSAATTDPKVLHFRDWAEGDGSPRTPYDNNGHGSHVSGIAGGTGEGASGDGPRGHRDVGVAWEAFLVGLKVLDGGGTGNAADIVAAINWAAANAASVSPPIRVLNISIGQLVNTGGAPGTSPQAAAVNAATAAGLVTAASAGNGDTDGLTPNVTQSNISSPGDAATSIAACSSDSDAPPDEPEFSTWDSEGPGAHVKPDVCAPGDGVRSVDANTTSGYVVFGGTSMSSPHVAGVAALIIQAVPAITPAQVKEVVNETASHFAAGHNADSGWGEIHAREAIELALARYGGPPQPLQAHLGGPYFVAQSETKTLTATATGGAPPYTFAWDLDDDGAFDDGAGPSATFTNSATLGAPTVRVRVTDTAPATSIDTRTVQVLAPISIFTDDVEDGVNGWAATSAGAATAAGWHQETFRSNSPVTAWYPGNDATVTYTNSEDVSLTRAFDLSTGAASTSGQLLLKFAMSGTLEPTFDFLRVQARTLPAGAFTQLAQYDDTDDTSWQTKKLDITAYRGQLIELAFRFTSDELVGPLEFTGPFLDDIRIVGTAAPVLDTTPPADITDLVAGVTTETRVALSWTATGDDGLSGTATSYDLRRATSPINAANFALATRVGGVPAPQPAGSPESFTVTGLVPGTTYHFAIKASDEASNAGAISNVVSAATIADAIAPSQVTNLAATAGFRRVSLTWAAATDNLGVVDHYNVYRDGVDVLDATGLSANITGLTNGTTYAFEVSAVDPSGNEGLRSLPVSATPVEPPSVPGWTQFHGNAARTGATGGRAGIATPRLLQELLPGGSVTSSPLIADLSGDGRMDVVAVSDATVPGARIAVKAFKQAPTGILEALWTFDIPVGVIGGNPTNGSGSLAIGDLDLDGLPEVVAYSNYVVNLGGVTANDGRLTVLKGADGSLVGALPNTDVVIGLRAAPAIGDVTGDGNPEIVIARQTGGTAAGYYLMSASVTGGALVKGFDTNIGTPVLFASPALGELRSSHDGLEVVIAQDAAAGKVFVCRPTSGSAVCGGTGNEVAVPSVRGLALGDLDGDGVLEIVTNSRSGASLRVINSATMTFVSSSDGFLWNTPTLGDVDGDGNADILNVNYSEFIDDAAKQGDVRARGFAAGAIVDKGTLARPPAPGASTQAAGGGALVDLVGDTKPEFVLGSGDSKLVAVKFESPPANLWSLDLPGNPVSPVAIGDVNGDGRLDLVSGTSNGRLVVVGNRPPVLAAVGNKTVAENAALSVTLDGTDPDGDELTYSASNLPAGATFDPATRTFAWAPSFDQAGSFPGVRFTVTDGGTDVSEDITITVTNVPRAPLITLPVEGALLNTSTPAVSGTAEPGVSVELLVDGTPAGTVAAGGGGAWSLTTPVLAEGSHAATARASDGVTTGALSAPRNFTIDTVAPPTPVLTAPAALVGDPTPTISGTAEANASVAVLVDGTPVGTAPADGAGAWSYTLTDPQALADGAHEATATARDAAGNTSAVSAARSFTVDTLAPLPPVIAVPSEGALLNDSTPVISGTAEPGASVAVVIDGVPSGTVTADGAGAWSLTAPVLGDGAHSADATATDAAGNISAASAPRGFRIDATVPGVPVILLPVEGASLNDSTPAVSGTAEAGATVEVFIDGVSAGSVTADGTGAWSFVAPALPDGAHSATARATDAAGNVSAVSTARNFTIDTLPPGTPVVTVPSEGALLNDSTPVISGAADPGASVAVVIDGVPAGTVTADGAGAWSLTAPVLLDGAHSATARATDAAGNVSALSAARSFTIDTAAPPAPVVTAPTAGARISDPTPTVSGTAEPGASVAVLIDGVQRGTVTADGTGAWSYTLTAAQTLPDGAHAATARATDAAGNVSALSAARSFTIDTLAPGAPVIAAPSEGTLLTDPRPTISGTAEAGSSVEVLVDGAVVGTVQASGTGAWSYTLTAAQALADGAHAATARATDVAGNASALSSTRNFRIDSSAPLAPTIAFVDSGDGQITEGQSLSVFLTGAREAGTSLRITVSDMVDETPDVILALPAGAAAFSAGPADLSGLALGRLTATAVATDAQGRASLPGLATTRKVPDVPGPVPPRVEIRDRDGIVSPPFDDVGAVPVDVTHLGPALTADMTLEITDGTTTRPLALGTLSLDTPFRVVADLSPFADGEVRVRASYNPTGQDVTVLDRTAPVSTWSSSTTSTCVVIPVIAFTNCRLEGTAVDPSTGISLVYVTGRHEDGAVYARHAVLGAPGERETTFTLSGSRLSTLQQGEWVFEAQGEDKGGNFEAGGSNSVTVLVL